MRLAILLALLATGCASPPSPAPAPEASAEVLYLAWGSSFGMCQGYCVTRLEVSWDGQATLTRQAPRTGEAEQVSTRKLAPDEYTRLTRAYRHSRLATADSVYGCPDCADGGAEYVETGTGIGLQRVTFEYGSPPPPAAPLAEAMRALRATFPEG